MVMSIGKYMTELDPKGSVFKGEVINRRKPNSGVRTLNRGRFRGIGVFGRQGLKLMHVGVR